MTADFTFLLISIIIEMEDHIRPHQVIEKHSYQNRPHQFRGGGGILIDVSQRV